MKRRIIKWRWKTAFHLRPKDFGDSNSPLVHLSPQLMFSQSTSNAHCEKYQGWPGRFTRAHDARLRSTTVPSTISAKRRATDTLTWPMRWDKVERDESWSLVPKLNSLVLIFNLYISHFGIILSEFNSESVKKNGWCWAHCAIHLFLCKALLMLGGKFPFQIWPKIINGHFSKR